MSLHVHIDEPRAVLTLSGSVTLGHCEAVQEQAADLLRRGFSEFVVDISDVSTMDSYGLGLIVDIHRAIALRGGTLRIVGATDRLRPLLSTISIDDSPGGEP